MAHFNIANGGDAYGETVATERIVASQTAEEPAEEPAKSSKTNDETRPDTQAAGAKQTAESDYERRLKKLIQRGAQVERKLGEILQRETSLELEFERRLEEAAQSEMDT